MRLLSACIALFAFTACGDEPDNFFSGSSHEHEAPIDCPDPDATVYEFVFDADDLGTGQVLFDSPNTFRPYSSDETTLIRGTFETATCKINGTIELRYRYGHTRPGPAIYGTIESDGDIHGPGFVARRVF